MALADHYELVGPLGEGSFGEVFRASHRVSGQTVAIKFLHRQDDDALRRFHREAVILHHQLANDFVVGLLDHGLNDEDPYIVLEYCDLGSLRSWVGSGRAWRDIAVALLHAAKGLSGLHAAGGVHRDIKPENMLVKTVTATPGWTVKVGDFGVAGLPNPVTGNMTRSGWGTDGYIAPEILGGAPFHSSADVYSLGVAAVELLVGRIDVAALEASAAPSALKALVRSMVNGMAPARPTAKMVAEKLEALLAGRPVNLHVKPASVDASNRTTSLASNPVATGVAVVGLSAIAYGFLNWLSDKASTYYDPSVGRNRGSNGQFRKS